jgi:hypothetical protein
VSDIERIPSLRKDPGQGVRRKAKAEPQPEPELGAQAEAEAEAEVEVRPQVRPERAAEPAPQPAPETLPLTLRTLLGRVDGGWYAFRAAAVRFPSERMDEHLTDGGWTRKQMLAHIAAWHDLTSDRVIALIVTGRPTELERDDDAINAGVARIAIGKTAGEVLKDVEATFNRLRRQMQRLNDAQLRLFDGWAAQIIAGNTYEHYAEHMADLYLPEPVEGAAQRR